MDKYVVVRENTDEAVNLQKIILNLYIISQIEDCLYENYPQLFDCKFRLSQLLNFPKRKDSRKRRKTVAINNFTL